MSAQASLNFPEQLRIKENVSAADLTTFGFGGVVKTLYEVRGVSPLQRLVSEPALFLGAGSNLLVRDQGVEMPVLRLGGEFNAWSRSAEAVTLPGFEWLADWEDVAGDIFAGAATSLMALSRNVSKLGLSGLEFAAGIPASIGGGVRMNCGAHGASLADVISSVYVLERGELRRYLKEELKFDYRRISLANDVVVLGATFSLRPDNPEEILTRRDQCLNFRKKTQPLSLPSAGSIFRNPSGSSRASDSGDAPATMAAAQLLQAAGLKGMRYGGVAFSDLHANWLVKVGDEARASDALYLIDHAIERVLSQFGVELHPELVVW